MTVPWASLTGSTRSANGLLMNMMMMSDENHRDIYISTVAMPPIMHCPGCRDMALAHPGESASPHPSCKESLTCLSFFHVHMQVTWL